MLPATGQVVMITLGVDTHLDIEAEQLQYLRQGGYLIRAGPVGVGLHAAGAMVPWVARRQGILPVAIIRSSSVRDVPVPPDNPRSSACSRSCRPCWLRYGTCR